MADILQFTQTRAAAKIQQKEAETEAKQIELGVVQREADRKAKLARALASQTASAGARGIAAFEGSPLSILQADIEAEERGTGRDIFQAQLAAMTTRARGRITRKQQEAGAITTLIGSLQQKAETAMKAGVGG